jgi:formylglycine-generating enzyme required for sulfatase activity
LPVTGISWHDVKGFINTLNEKTGKQYRLPTEAEWEFAARGGILSKGFKYSGSNNIDDVAWYLENSGLYTHPAGTKQPNELGIYDMTGNVWEWCQDWYDSYSEESQTTPTGPDNGYLKVMRGGSYNNRGPACRVDYREIVHPINKYTNLGFRLAL